MATFANVDLQEPSTVTAELAAVQLTRNSSAELQEIMTIGDPEVSTALARVVSNADAGSTLGGLVVRPIFNSTAAQNKVTVYQSTASNLLAQVDQNSTVWPVQVSSVAGVVSVSPVSTASVRVSQSSQVNLLATIYQSTANDLQVTVDNFSTTVQVSSAGGYVRVIPPTASASSYIPVRLTDGAAFLAAGNEYVDGSTYSSLTGVGLTYNNSSNNTMRQVSIAQPLPVQLVSITPTMASTTAFVTSTHSTAVYELISSVASQRHKVYAVSVFSTHTRPSTILFLSSLGQTIYAMQFGSGSSGVTGAVNNVSPPGFLFATESQAALNAVVEDGSTAASTTLVRINVSYFTE